MNHSSLKLPHFEYDKWISVFVSIAALAISAYAFYSQILHEEHDFRVLVLRENVLLINAGNRTESLVEVKYLYSKNDWNPKIGGGEFGKPSGPFVLKPGEAQMLQLQPTPLAQLDDAIRDVHHVGVYFLSADTRTMSASKEGLIETVVGFNIVSPAGAGPGPFDRGGFHNLYEGREAR